MNSVNNYLEYLILKNRIILRLLAITFTVLLTLACRESATASSTLPEGQHTMELCRFTKLAQSGTPLTIELESPGATGAEWFVDDLPPSITLISQGQHPSERNTGQLGGPIVQWWKFNVGHTKATTLSINFFLYRRWEGKDKAFKHCTVDIVFQ